MSKVKLNKVEVKVSKVVIDKEDGIYREDKCKNNPGRPVNKKSARYIRLQQQSWYETINAKFVNGNMFKLKENQQAVFQHLDVVHPSLLQPGYQEEPDLLCSTLF